MPPLPSWTLAQRSGARHAPRSTLSRSTLPPLRAFTLIEIMVVIAIIGIMLTMGVPSIYRRIHPESMQKAVNDVMEACSDARAHAILNNVDTELVIRPFERQISVVVVGHSAPPTEDRLFSPSVSGEEWRMQERPPAQTSGAGGSVFSATLSDHITIEGLGVNGQDWTDEEVARVRFYPNGTCDEMSIVLLSDKQERRNIWLEVVTALAEFETDPYKFKAR